MRSRSFIRAASAILSVVLLSTSLTAQNSKRPMTFLDMQHLRTVSGTDVSPDRQQLLYTLSVPDWKEAKRQTDIYVVDMKAGVPSTRQLTFTKEKNETSPQWAKDGSFFAFLSNRDAPAGSSSQNQLYAMRVDGGEARQITTAKEGVSNFSFSYDGRWIAYRSGKSGEEQLYLLPVEGLDTTSPVQLTKQAAGVGNWEWSPDSRRIYFVTADTVDAAEKERREKKFTVDIRNPETPRSSLYAVDVAQKQTTRLTHDTTYVVTNIEPSRDGKWIAFRGVSPDRYHRTVTEQGLYADFYLLELATGHIERLTNNEEVGEQQIAFSPDGRWLAFTAPDDLENYSMTNRRIYLRRVDERGGAFRKLGQSFDGDLQIGFWSDDGKTIYFNEGIRATNQLMALDLERNTVRQVSNLQASLSVNRDQETGALLINYADPTTPPTIFSVANVSDVANRARWRQLTDANPQVRSFALGEETEITWTSTDGKPVGGVLVKPVGYEAGKRYPLVVAIHGGPASADVLGFNGGYGSQVYAGAGYMVLRPNYRGSTNYGEKHKTDIVGNYFEPGYQDIMAGVDHLIQQGLVDPEQMGVFGWSAGGHWSNWILTHTDRFKAISSGAGTSNWISMYAQSDVQRNRQFYLGNKLPYDDFEAYWNQSPIKYIRNAKTPTMIHVVQGDPRVPSPQSVELHMALKKIGVPTELFVYPGNSHGIPDPRNQYVKQVSEMAWMDYYVRGKGEKFSWRAVLESLQDPKPAVTAAEDN